LTTDYYTSQEAYFDLVFDPIVEVHSVQIINHQMVCVQHRKTEEFIEDAANTNVIVAAWVTAQARLKLYEYLEQLDNRVLYMDTGQYVLIVKLFFFFSP
jgi:predicted RecB family endonuclease